MLAIFWLYTMMFQGGIQCVDFNWPNYLRLDYTMQFTDTYAKPSLLCISEWEGGLNDAKSEWP